MKPPERSLSYLEHAITVAAFGTEEGRDAFLTTHGSEDLLEIAMRHASPTLRADYIQAAQPLATCGIQEVEARAKQIIALASQPLSHDHDEFSAQEWENLGSGGSGERKG